MDVVFLKVLNMSITATWVVLGVVLFRFLLKKAPKWISCILWSLVAIRLILPSSIESIFSLITSSDTIDTTVYNARPFIESGIHTVDNRVNGYLSSRYNEGVTVPAGNTSNILTILGVIWIIGIILMLVYTVISYIRIQKKVGEAALLKENTWICDNIDTPFILGIFKPRIYIPSTMSEQDMEYVIAHEKAHLKRRDHLWKPFGFLLLSLHWFNPIVWIAYVLLCRDIESACDEKVIKEKGTEIKKCYSEALINCSVPRKSISACPLAFGETGVKQRIKGVLNYKKPAFWIIMVAIITLIITSVCLLTNPSSIKLQNIEDISLGSIKEVYISNGETYDSVGALSKDLLKDLTDIKISKTEISKSRSEYRDKSHTIVLQEQHAQHTIYSYVDRIYIHFNSDFKSVWVNNITKPTLSYKVKNPNEAERVYNLISTYNVSAPAENSVDKSQNVTVTKNIKSIVDKTIEENIPTDQALEYIYSDSNYDYFFPSIRSQYVIVTFNDSTQKTAKEALLNKEIKISDLDYYVIDYIKTPSCFEPGTTTDKQIFDAEVIEVKNNSILVTSYIKPNEARSSEKIYISFDPEKLYVPELKVRDTVRIVYSEYMTETYPAQINSPYAIFIP